MKDRRKVEGQEGEVSEKGRGWAARYRRRAEGRGIGEGQGARYRRRAGDEVSEKGRGRARHRRIMRV